VVTPAAKPPTAAPPTPKPRQSLLTVLTSGVKMKATATARKKSAAKAHALPLFHACCLRSLWPGGPAGCPACFGYATRSYAQPHAPLPVPLCLCYVLCMYVRVHRAHLPALGSWAHPGCTGCSPEKAPARPHQQRRAFLVFSTTPSATPSATPTPAKKAPSPNFVRLGVG
jgi:hypothetical protein